MGKITIAFCLVAVCLLATSPTLACPEGYSGGGAFCVPNDSPDVKLNNPSKPSPSDEATVKPRHKTVTKLGVRCPKGYTGTPPNCSPLYQDGKKVIFF